MENRTVEYKTKREAIKQLALEGKEIEEIASLVETSQTYVRTTLHRLRTSRSFSVTYDQKFSPGRQAIIDIYHRFNVIHGFFPTAAWVARVLKVSRAWVAKARPPLEDQEGKFIKTSEPFTFPKDFMEFIEGYAKIYNITKREALQSFTYNLGLSKKDLIELKQALPKGNGGTNDYKRKTTKSKNRRKNKKTTN